MFRTLLSFGAGLCLLLMSGFNAPHRTPVAQLVTEWERAKAYTKEYLDAMPEDGYAFKPTPEVRSFAEMMLHLANANYGFLSATSGKSNPNQGGSLEKTVTDKSKANITKTVMDSYDFVIDALKGMTDAQMAETAKVFNRDMTRELAVMKAFEHQTHHRGQTTVYLRLKGVKPPNEKLF